jgi:predicted 3-demethylubiquinone-9 3-methyltransferase (glyoxalase superfamily)
VRDAGGLAAGKNHEIGFKGARAMQGVRPCLVFNDRAEEAVNLYVSLFEHSEVLSMMRSDGNGPIPSGRLLHATFTIDGREYTAFDGGPTFSFAEGTSLVATCDTQDEVDRLWSRLTEGGGEPGRCGWLKDRFGMSWQIIPAALGEMMGDPAHGDSAAVMQAMLRMDKLDIATLRQAYGRTS